MIPYEPQPLGAETRAQFASVTVATLTTQLYKRGIRSACIGGVHPLNPEASRVVGPAFTLRHIPMREDITRWEIRTDPEYPQRKAIETTPAGDVLVMDCRGDTSAGLAGDILIQRLIVRGVAGVVADGGMRDSAEIAAMDLPVFCLGPAGPPAVSAHHAVELQVPIACGGVAVIPGDIIVGDEDGVVVIPSNIAAEVAQDAVEQERYERFAQEQVVAGRSIFGLYPAEEAALAEYQDWLKAGGDS